MVTPPVNGGVEDVDPLDSRLSRVRSGGERTPRRWGSPMRLALGLSPTPRQGLVLLPLGMALGPRGLGVLTEGVLTSLDPAVSVALAALGVFVGLDLTVRRAREGLMLAAASVEAAVTILVVAAGALVLPSLWPASAAAAPWLLALLLGVCASASSTAAGRSSDRSSIGATRIGDLDDVLPILLGVLALAFMREGSMLPAARLTAETVLIALTIAAAGWLLVSQTSSESEQRVFAIGALLLLGGAAAHLSLSALFAGLVAGAFWNLTGSLAAERITADVRYLQHPLVVLLLLVAGARLDLSTGAASLVVLYLACRIAGKLAGGWLAGWLAGRDLTRGLALSLIPPGIVGIAFALNLLQARGEGDAATTMVVTIVVAGSIGSELISLMAAAPARQEPA